MKEVGARLKSSKYMTYPNSEKYAGIL
jgi:hypothetical protein